MNTAQQILILDHRKKILKHVEEQTGTLPERLQAVIPNIQQLGVFINQWIDAVAITYRASGMEIDEWYEDVIDWLTRNDFRMEEVESLPQANGRRLVTLHCHISNSDIGRNVVIKFSLMR